MKQQNHYNQALAYLRDFCLRHGRLMHRSALATLGLSKNDRGAVLEAEGTAARLSDFVYFRHDSAIFKQKLGWLSLLRQFGYIESGSIHYLIRNYEGGESTVESVAAGDLVGNYPYCLDGDAAPTSLVAVVPSAVYVVDGADLERHYRQSQAAERIGRDFLRPFGGKRQAERMAYRLGQVKSHINNFYFKNNHTL